MSEPATDWVIKQIQDYGLEPLAFGAVILVGLAFAIGSVFGWKISIGKAKAEIKKLRAEAMKASGENIEKLAGLREKSNSAGESVKLAMLSLRDSLTANKSPEHLRTCRDEMCNLYDVNYLPAVSKYTEMISTLVDPHECLQRAKTELIPGLKTMCSFLCMMNLPKMLEKTGGERFLLRREVRDGFLDRVYALIPRRYFKLRWQLKRIRKETDQFLRE